MGSFVFGPVNSRRFGISLGIDLSSHTKQCNFNCVYCELEPKKPQDDFESPANVDDIINELKSKITPDIDIITITSNGEPTLYPHLKELVIKINEIKGNKKTLILSNGTLFGKKDTQDALMHIDIVKFSLDGVSEKIFKRVDKPTKSINIKSIIQGIKDFSALYRGQLIAEILVVKNINDSEDEIGHIAHTLKDIGAHRVDISTIDRPPAHRVQPVSQERLEELSILFEGLNVVVVKKADKNKQKIHYSKEGLLELAKRRPINSLDIDTMFDKKSIQNLQELVSLRKIQEIKSYGVTFYKTH